LDNPPPRPLSGKNRFQSPASFALAFISSITGGAGHRFSRSYSKYTLSLK